MAETEAVTDVAVEDAVEQCMSAHNELEEDVELDSEAVRERRAKTITDLDNGNAYVIGENDPDFDFDTFELHGESAGANQQPSPSSPQLPPPSTPANTITQTATAAKLTWWQAITSLGGLLYTPIDTHASRHHLTSAPHSYTTSSSSSARTPFTKLSSFKFRKELGRGAFGRVLLAEAKIDGSLYALKIISKKNMRSSDKRQAKAERDILHAMGHTAPHPFTTGLKFAFQSENNLYLGMNFIAGGSLRELIKKHSCLPEAWVRFYSCELVLAISHLHSMHVLYRDIKPHNVMLDAEGHIQIIDFGLSKQEIDHPRGAMSLVGTPDYSAPEVLKTGVHQLEASKKARQQQQQQQQQRTVNKQGGTGQDQGPCNAQSTSPRAEKGKTKHSIGYGKAADWWSLGVMIYEMLTGTPAFRGADLRQTYQKVLFAELEFVPGDKFSPTSRALLAGLLRRDPSLRLGAGANSPQDIFSAAFFEGVEWDRVYNRALPVPLIPTLTYRKRESTTIAIKSDCRDELLEIRRKPTSEEANPAIEAEKEGGSKSDPTSNVASDNETPSRSSSFHHLPAAPSPLPASSSSAEEEAPRENVSQSTPSTPSTQSESDELMSLRDSVFVGRGGENRLQDWSFCDEKVLLSVASNRLL